MNPRVAPTCHACTVLVAWTFAFCPWCGAALRDASGRFVGAEKPAAQGELGL